MLDEPGPRQFGEPPRHQRPVHLRDAERGGDLVGGKDGSTGERVTVGERVRHGV